MTYAITKKFVSGALKDIEYKELTGVQFVEGKQYDNYIITSCKPIDNNTTVQMEAKRPYQHGGGTAFVSGSYEYIKQTAKQWRNAGYYDFHTWVD